MNNASPGADPRNLVLFERIARFIDVVWRPYHRAEVFGLSHVPKGAALFVGNHNGGTNNVDSWLFVHALYRRFGIQDVPFGLAHQVGLRVPLVGRFLRAVGAVEAGHESALALFGEGRKVLVYPGGDVDSFRPFRHRNRVIFGGRRGYIRLALRAGVPIVPVVAAGAQETFIVLDDLRWLARLLGTDRLLRIKAWPLVFSLPWGLTLGPPLPHFPLPSRVLIEVLPPIHFEQTGPEAAQDDALVARYAAEVEAQMQSCLTRLAAERRRLGWFGTAQSR